MSEGRTNGGALADLRSAIDRVTKPPLVVAVAALMLVLLLAVVGRHLVTLEAPSGGRIDIGTGDFMAFWTGATTIHEGRGDELYDYAAQQRLQGRLLGGDAPEFQPYLNPPLLAVLLSWLVPLGYVPAFYVYGAVCLGLLLAGIAALLAMAPAVRSEPHGPVAAVLLVASWQPMILTTLGGQNSAITFALLSALALAVTRRQAACAALALGLLTYKPQYAAGIGTALLLAGEWRIVAGGALLGVVHYLLGAWTAGADWPADMMRFVQAYRPLELSNNAGTHFSWVRTADFVLPSPFDTLAALAGVAVVLATWWRLRACVRSAPGAWVSLVVCGTMLASPHQQYYDAALLALPVLLLLDNDLRTKGSVALRTRVLLLAAYVGYPAWSYAGTIGIQPLFVVLLLVFLWSVSATHANVAAEAAR